MSKYNYPSCSICDNYDWNTTNELLIKCNNCGLVRAKGFYTKRELSKLYKKDYFFGSEYNNYINDRSALEKNFKHRIKYLEDNKWLDSNSKVLELGCAYGFFLNLIKNKVNFLQGIDINKEAVVYAKNELGLNVKCVDYLKYNDNIKYDLVCLWDVIEHLQHPEKVLKKINTDMKKGGKLILTTGDIGSLLAIVQKNKWRMIHPPTHIFYFSKNTISSILNKCGFQVVSINYRPTYRNLGSVLNQVFVKKTQYKKFINKLNIKKLIFGVNTFDIMEVVAVKTTD